VAEAVDGHALKRDRIDPSVVRPGTLSYMPGSIGSAMSHRAIWLRCAAGRDPALICEDDAALRWDAASAIPALMAGAPAGWDMICLGYNPDTAHELNLGGDIHVCFGFPRGNPTRKQLGLFIGATTPVGIARLTAFFGLCAYLVSPAGARRLLDACFPLDDRYVMIKSLARLMRAQTLDFRINDHLAELAAYAAIPPLALPDNDPVRSAKAAS
jgi:glycosyl transferase, family 25